MLQQKVKQLRARIGMAGELRVGWMTKTKKRDNAHEPHLASPDQGLACVSTFFAV